MTTSPGISSSDFDADVIEDVVVVRDAKLLVTDGPELLKQVSQISIDSSGVTTLGDLSSFWRLFEIHENPEN